MEREAKTPKRSLPWFVGAVALVAVVALVLWSQWDNLTGSAAQEDTPTPAATESSTAAPGNDPLPTPASLPAKAATAWAGDPSVPGECAEVEAELMRLCAQLDSRDYLRQAAPGGACGLLSEVAAALTSRTPEPSLELRSYETVLANVYHVFRAVGRERMEVLRRALRQERDLGEPLALAMYRWSVSRESCARSGDTPVRREALYGYAGFLFQTVGGQAYLRRRSPRVEALVSFSALLTIDKAERDGNNPLGFDVLPEIERTRELIAAQDFVHEEHYLELLAEIEHRRAERGP